MNEPAVSRPVLVVSAAALTLAIGAGVWFGGRVPEPPPLETTPSGASPREVGSGRITVDVSGAVGTPGLVEVPAGGRVADAIAAAGGALQDADLESVNLAAPLLDGHQVLVPRRGETGDGAPGADGRVALNTATAQQLEAIPGVGPVLAERIFAYRQEHGPFATVEDLLDVPGIGEGKLAALRDSVIVP